MLALHALALALVLTADTPADGTTARTAVREALRDAAPLPSRAPVLPESRGLPGTQDTQVTRAMRRDAQRTAIEHARKDAGQARHEAQHQTTRHGDAGDTHGGHGMEDVGCDPAEMMRSRHTMPGGDHSMPGSPHHGS